MSDSDDDNTQNDDLCDLLECPVCFNTSQPPIYMCASGHHVCARCQPSLTKCPTCRAPGKPTVRCLLLEKMADKVRLQCANRRDGCRVELDAERMVKHWETCQTRYRHDCKICKSKRQFNRQGLIDHVKKIHPGSFSNEECNQHRVNMADAFVHKNVRSNILVSIKDELIWIHCNAFDRGSKFSFGAHYVGYDFDEAKEYECKFKYCTADNKPIFKCSSTVQLNTSFPIDADLLSSCLVNGHFPFTSRIIWK